MDGFQTLLGCWIKLMFGHSELTWFSNHFQQRQLNLMVICWTIQFLYIYIKKEGHNIWIYYKGHNNTIYNNIYIKDIIMVSLTKTRIILCAWYYLMNVHDIRLSCAHDLFCVHDTVVIIFCTIYYMYLMYMTYFITRMK